MRLIRLFLVLILFVSMGCSNDGTETGNPGVTLVMSDFTTSSLSKMGIAPMAVSQVTMCFKRLRFKMASEVTNTDPTADEDNIDLNLGQVVLNPAGEELVTVNVPPGDYTRIEFDLEKDCLGVLAPSVIVDNDNDGGTPFETEDRITIKFEGAVTVSADMTLDLAIGNIISALDTVTDPNDIKTILEDVSAVGSF